MNEEEASVMQANVLPSQRETGVHLEPVLFTEVHTSAGNRLQFLNRLSEHIN